MRNLLSNLPTFHTLFNNAVSVALFHYYKLHTLDPTVTLPTMATDGYTMGPTVGTIVV
jgi:predicted methyltransferase